MRYSKQIISLAIAVFLAVALAPKAQAQQPSDVRHPTTVHECIVTSAATGTSATHDVLMHPNFGGTTYGTIPSTAMIQAIPDVPRNLNILLDDATVAAPGISCSIVIVGLNQWGTTVTEQLDSVTTVASTGVGRIAWSKITSISWKNVTGGQYADTIAVDFGEKLGLMTPVGVWWDVWRLTRATAWGSPLVDSSYTIDTKHATISPGSVTATEEFNVWIRSTNRDPDYFRRNQNYPN